jgi:type III restriction enzyme
MSFLAEEERDDLPLVNALRDDVRRWRAVTGKTPARRRRNCCAIGARRPWATAVLLPGRGGGNDHLLEGDSGARQEAALDAQADAGRFQDAQPGINPRPQDWVAKVAQHPKLADLPNEPGAKAIPRYACKMATGSGKTVVMAMLIAWAFCNRGTKPGDPRFPRRALVLCPNLTIKERLNVLRPGDPNNYFEQFDIVPSSLRPELAKGKVLVTNWHWLAPEAEVQKVGGAPSSSSA